MPTSLIVRSTHHVDEPVAGVGVVNDMIAQSKPLAWWREDRAKKPPHIAFANATTEATLIRFVRNWGPFDGTTQVCYTEGRSYTSERGWTLAVRQNLRKLRAEQRVFSGAARLIAEVQSQRPDIERMFNCYTSLKFLPQRESFSLFIQSFYLKKAETLINEVREDAETRLCDLLDKFRVRLFPTPTGPTEFLPMDIDGFRGRGVKYMLYYFLRLEYLRQGRLGLGLCPKCDEVFAKERRGALYCGAKCSNQQRGLDYYRERGRAKRQQKSAALKKARRQSQGRSRNTGK